MLNVMQRKRGWDHWIGEEGPSERSLDPEGALLWGSAKENSPPHCADSAGKEDS